MLPRAGPSGAHALVIGSAGGDLNAARRGRLDTGVVDLDPATLSAATYATRLGGLKRAYALIGYDRRTGRAGPRR